MSCDCAVLKALMTPGLTHAESRLYAYYVGKARSHGLCWPSVEQTKADLGIDSRATIASANKKLVARGLVAIKRRFQDTNHYQILDQDGLIYGRADTWAPPWTAQPEVEATVQLTEHLQVQSAEHLPEAQVQFTEHLQVQLPEHLPPSEAPCRVQLPEQESTNQERKKERKEERTLTLFGATATPPTVKGDIRKQLYDEGKVILREMDGILKSQAGAMISKFLRAANGNAAVVLESMRVAKREGPASGGAVPFILSAIKIRTQPDLKYRDPAVEMAHRTGLLDPASREGFVAGMTNDYSAFNRETANG